MSNSNFQNWPNNQKFEGLLKNFYYQLTRAKYSYQVMLGIWQSIIFPYSNSQHSTILNVQRIEDNYSLILQLMLNTENQFESLLKLVNVQNIQEIKSSAIKVVESFPNENIFEVQKSGDQQQQNVCGMIKYQNNNQNKSNSQSPQIKIKNECQNNTSCIELSHHSQLNNLPSNQNQFYNPTNDSLYKSHDDIKFKQNDSLSYNQSKNEIQKKQSKDEFSQEIEKENIDYLIQYQIKVEEEKDQNQQYNLKIAQYEINNEKDKNQCLTNNLQKLNECYIENRDQKSKIVQKKGHFENCKGVDRGFQKINLELMLKDYYIQFVKDKGVDLKYKEFKRKAKSLFKYIKNANISKEWIKRFIQKYEIIKEIKPFLNKGNSGTKEQVFQYDN